MNRVVLLVCALAWSAAVFGQAGERIDLKAYKPSTLEKLFSATPKSPAAVVELLAQDELVLIEGTWTGQKRAAGAELTPLFNAWGESRQRKDGKHLSGFPRSRSPKAPSAIGCSQATPPCWASMENRARASRCWCTASGSRKAVPWR